MMFDPSVIKPFGILIIVTLGGIILCGFPITTYYFVPLLLESKIPIDSYWTAAFLASYRATLSLLTLPFIGRCPKRQIHFGSGVFLILGLLSLSISTYLIHEVDIQENYPMTGWIPIISILLICTSQAIGWENSIIALQAQCLKITKNVVFEIFNFVHFLPIFVLSGNIV